MNVLSLVLFQLTKKIQILYSLLPFLEVDDETVEKTLEKFTKMSKATEHHLIGAKAGKTRFCGILNIPESSKAART